MANPKEAAIELRRNKVFQLRLEGGSYRSIAEDVGVSVGTVFSDVKAVMDRLREQTMETAEQARSLDVDRLDIALHGLMPKVKEGDERAIDAMCKVLDRRAKLLGIDAPEKIDLNATATPEKAADAVRRMFGQHASKGAGAVQGDAGEVPPGDPNEG